MKTISDRVFFWALISTLHCFVERFSRYSTQDDRAAYAVIVAERMIVVLEHWRTAGEGALLALGVPPEAKPDDLPRTSTTVIGAVALRRVAIPREEPLRYCAGTIRGPIERYGSVDLAPARDAARRIFGDAGIVFELVGGQWIPVAEGDASRTADDDDGPRVPADIAQHVRQVSRACGTAKVST